MDHKPGRTQAHLGSSMSQLQRHLCACKRVRFQVIHVIAMLVFAALSPSQPTTTRSTKWTARSSPRTLHIEHNFYTTTFSDNCKLILLNSRLLHGRKVSLQVLSVTAKSRVAEACEQSTPQDPLPLDPPPLETSTHQGHQLELEKHTSHWKKHPLIGKSTFAFERVFFQCTHWKKYRIGTNTQAPRVSLRVLILLVSVRLCVPLIHLSSFLCHLVLFVFFIGFHELARYLFFLWSVLFFYVSKSALTDLCVFRCLCHNPCSETMRLKPKRCRQLSWLRFQSSGTKYSVCIDSVCMCVAQQVTIKGRCTARTLSVCSFLQT